MLVPDAEPEAGEVAGEGGPRRTRKRAHRHPAPPTSGFRVLSWVGPKDVKPASTSPAFAAGCPRLVLLGPCAGVSGRERHPSPGHRCVA